MLPSITLSMPMSLCAFALQRIESAVLSGCIPLWSALEQVPALPRILRHERILVRLSAATRPALAHLPALLRCYSSRVRAAIVSNLEMTWPAFAWGDGTAYYHTLLEMAELTNKTVPSAIKVVLEVGEGTSRKGALDLSLVAAAAAAFAFALVDLNSCFAPPPRSMAPGTSARCSRSTCSPMRR